MSSNATSWGWGIPTQPYSKLVLICLADNADTYGRCNFSIELLAMQCALPIEEVNACLKELISSSIIIQSPANKTKRQLENWIEVLLNIQTPIKNFNAMTDGGLNHAKD